MNQKEIFAKPEIIFEDDYILVVTKEAEELTVPGRGESKQHCLMSRSREFLGDVYNVHRLDQPTSGLVLLSKSKQMQSEMSQLFAQRQVHKEYIAIVEGYIMEEFGIIELPIAKDINNRPMQIIDLERGKYAKTSWEVIERSKGRTRLFLRPETGRTHQLRVHLKALGFPIIGDRLYNNNCPDDLWGLLKLHAYSLEFIHPHSGERLYIKKDPPF